MACTDSSGCKTMYCNSDSVCASCDGSDDNCPDDYECSDGTCVVDESITTAALIGIIVGASFIFFIAVLVIWFCCKAKDGQDAQAATMHEALTNNEN